MTADAFLPQPLSSTLIADLYTRFTADPSDVDATLRDFFSNLNDEARTILEAQMTCRETAATAAPLATQHQVLLDVLRAATLIRATRMRGHVAARLDPLGLTKPTYKAELDPVAYGFGERDKNRPLFVGGALGLQTATLGDIMAALQKVYGGSIGLEFAHIQNPAQKAWIQEYFENPANHPPLSGLTRKKALERLIEAETFEQFLARHFPSVQRFSLEGSEALLPLLDAAFARGTDLGLEEIVIGMSHRGRLNLLANLLNKPLEALFAEFQDIVFAPDEAHAAGDLKYHLGCSTDRRYGSRNVHLSLTSNPSHLEIVCPVVAGRVRAKQQQRIEDKTTYADARHKVMGVLLHGDAAIAGQGIVAETMMLSDLDGYTTGGLLHIVVNNQIGFTASPAVTHSGPHCTEVAKIVQAPIFHVNADDIEAVLRVAEIAAAYRQKFHQDVVIDLVGYRRRGHSENDDPSLMHPLMYARIADHPTVTALYGQQLTEEGVVTTAEIEAMRQRATTRLDEALAASKKHQPEKADWLEGHWLGYAPPPPAEPLVETGLLPEKLHLIGQRLTTVPPDFALHPTLQAFLERRRERLDHGRIDWSLAEALAFGSLAIEKTPVRLSGQDSERGTFMQRHATWVDRLTGATHAPFQALMPEQAPISIINSPLSEAAVLGFEYGYSLSSPESLVIWEAQFGDFANGAQIIIDQFLASGEAKWLRLSGLVLMLPHGYEGQGPEHSSARLERFLQLAAHDNLQIAQPTTPANLFHLLRRQVVRNYRKPLVLMTPKSLMRHPLCLSPLDAFGVGHGFQHVLDDPEVTRENRNKIRCVLLTSGKIAIDLFAARAAQKRDDVAIVRLEQLYPFPDDKLASLLATYPQAEIRWVQEEPCNMGAATFVQRRLAPYAKTPERPVSIVARPEAASPAAGTLARHRAEQETLIAQAFDTSAP
jgi:2-oxoglutarate dehydrogenase E1 component